MAQDQEAVVVVQPEKESSPAKRLPYAGVVPDQTVGKLPSSASTLVTWPGFEVKADGTARVFVQLTRQVKTRVRLQGRELLVLLEGAAVPLANNRRPLDTRFFASPVLQAQVKKRGRDAALIIKLRQPVPYQVHQEARQDAVYLFAEFSPMVGAR